MLNTLRQIGIFNLANGPPTSNGNEFTWTLQLTSLSQIKK